MTFTETITNINEEIEQLTKRAVFIYLSVFLFRFFLKWEL